MPTKEKSMTYAKAGVNYNDIDPAKVRAQQLAPLTITGPKWLGVTALEKFRGESAYVLRVPGGHIAHVEEGLGTKVCIADLLYKKTGDPIGYNVVGQDTVAMILNDAATLGVPPVSLQMHLAAGFWRLAQRSAPD